MAATADTPHTPASSPPFLARWRRVTALEGRDHESALRELLGALQDEEVFVRLAAAQVLAGLPRPDTVPHLAAALEDADASVRREAIQALAGLGAAAYAAVPALRKRARTEPDKELARRCREAAASIGRAVRRAPAELEAAAAPGGCGTEPEAASAPAGRGTELEAGARRSGT